MSVGAAVSSEGSTGAGGATSELTPHTTVAAGLSSLGPSTELLACPDNMAPLSDRSDREQDGSHSALYALISKVQPPHSHHTPFISSESPGPVHLKGAGIGPHLLEEGGSKDLWPNFKNTPGINLTNSLQITNAFAF